MSESNALRQFLEAFFHTCGDGQGPAAGSDDVDGRAYAGAGE